MKRRILSILLFAALVIGLLPQSILSVSAYSSTDIAYAVEGGNIYFDAATGTITDCDDTVTAADIPTEIDGVAVTSIGASAFESCTMLESTTIPESVTSIGDRGFYCCSALSAVYFMGDAPTIGESAFRILNILYDEPVIEVEDINIYGLVLYYIGGNSGWSTPTWNDYSTELWYGEDVQDPQDPQDPPVIDESVYPVPGGNIYINSTTGMIYACDDTVTYADIPAEIGGIAVTGIDESAFANCSSLTGVVIPEGATSIGNWAFAGCNSMTSVTMPESLASIDDHAFSSCSSLTDVTIPNSVTSVGDSAFSGCTGLTSVTLPEGITSIGSAMFSGCDSLTSVTIPEGVTSIGNSAFMNCFSLAGITIPESVTSIGDGAFYFCCSLESVTIPESVTSIGSEAFYWCEGLDAVYFKGDAPAIGSCVFYTMDEMDDIIISGLTLYYIEGKADWTTPTWNGYPTATWDGVNVPEPADEIAYPVEGGNLYFRKSTGEIFDCDTTVTNADIPEKIVGVAVTTIGDHAFYKCSNLTSVTIPSGVTSIGVCTFEYCDSLASVTIPNSIISINSNAFSGCSSLTSVTIPDSVTSIGNKAFEDCSSLQLVCFMGDAPTLGIAAFQISNPPKYFNIPGLTLYYIEGKEGWTSPTWNGYLTAIWDGVNVPETADEVTYPAEGGNLYFRKSTGEIYDCDEAVTVADIPAEIDGVAVTGIGSYAFEDCSSLTSVTIPDSVTGIGEAAFWGCTGLTSVTIPENITYISDLTFVNCSGLTEIKIPSSVTRIGDGAFDCCHGLTSVTIPDSVKTIDDYAFHSCSSLTSVTIPSGVTSIGVCTFEYCDSLASVTIPNSIISINSNAFSGCSSLTSVTIPDSVTSIGNKAFEDCSSLQLVCFMGDAPTLGIAAFQISNPPKYFNIPGLTLYYIEGKANWTSPTWNGYPTATWDGVNVPEPADEIAYPVEGGNLYFRKSTGEIFDCDTTVTNADIPEKIVGVAVTTIGDHAFYKCSSLTSVTIPDSVTGICDSAFFACSSLTSVTIPEGVKSIGKQAFSYCSSLTSVTISGSVTSIGGYAFSYCSSLESVTIPGSVTSISDRTFYWCDSLTTVTILEGVTSIGGLAFGHCTGLTSVTIPDSVTNIGMSAFDNCSSLTSVTIPESVTSIGEGAFCDCSSLTAIHVAEGNTAYTSENGVLFDKNKTLLHTYPAGKTESEYIIPESVISIGSHAFYRCSNLTNVTIPVGVTSIVNYAFFMCSSLKSVTIPEGVKSISRCAFYGCSSLTSVTIPEGVKSIGISAFDACSSLTSVTIPGSVTSIGGYAFYACGSLQSLYFMGAAPALEAYAFSVWNAETQTYINNPNLILYYIDGKEGWTTPTWNSYPTATWMPVHEHSYVVVVTAPTCTEQGCTTHTCSICCDTYTDTYKEALGHDYGEWTLIKAATCTEKGEEKRTCSRCYSFETRETDAAGHTEVVDAAVPATCTEDGKTEGKHCDLCGVVIVAQETVAALGHDFGAWTQTKAPTCTEKGEEKRTCSRCDAFETSEIAAHGHTEVIDAAVPATCTEAGKTEGKHCDLCGTVIVAQETVAALGHDYGDWTQTKAPTCTETGEEKRVCSRCDAFETREIAARGHTEVVDAAVPATCTEAGKTEGKHCTVCGTVIVAQETAAALGHDYGDWTQTKAPTCTEKGEEKRTCSRCDAFEVREIAAHGHTEVIDPAVPATCTEAGLTEGKHCSVCGTVLVAQETVAALGHDYGDWTQTKAPTCTEKGEEKRTCSRCDAFEAREIAAHGHTEVIDPAVPATCTETGKTEGKHCSVCGTVLVAQETVAALGHDYGDWTQTKAPTCTEKGEEKRTCSRCDAFETREIAANGHTEVIDAAVPATCTEGGKTEGKHCSVCGTVIIAQETVDALGHDYGEWTQTKAPTCTEKGEEKRTCSRCDAFETREIAEQGHTEMIDPAVPATCTEAGKTEGKHCAVCGTVLVAQETVPALGHSYKDGVCTVCGAKDPDAQPAAPVEFTDVSEKAWYYDAVDYAVTNNLMNGIGNGKFDPEGSMTRAMLVTVLWRYEGEPAEGKNTFTDVPDGTWYTGAVAWAAANGIVGGVGNGKFDPEGRITREQMATLLFRYAQKKGIDTSKRGNLNSFPDSGKVSSWAKDALRWAIAEKIITGSDGYLIPQGNATRAQVAALLMRFVNKIEAGDEVTELPVDPKHVVTAGTRKAYIGMSLEDLSEYAGEPEEILSTTAGYTWYVYGTEEYTDYFMVGIYEHKVVAICASGADFSYRGCSANGSEAAAEADDTYSINVLKDKNDNSAVYGILLTDKEFRVQYAETKEALAGESRVAFHMANAFRVLHGVGILTWCDKAATAARLHSEDMATQNYVSHTSADGRLFYMRLRENGVLYNTCAENLCAGYYSGVGAHNAWVNSALHRANLLNASMDRCGVGFAYELNSDYRYYAVSDYYQAR